MRTWLVVFLGIGLFEIVIFGFIVYTHHAPLNVSLSDCATVAAEGMTCPAQRDPLSMLDFHLNAIRQLFTFPINDISMFLLGIIIASLLLLVLGRLGPGVFFGISRPLARLKRDRFRIDKSSYQSQFISWLLQLEAGPNKLLAVPAG